jgi:hypothetical protein
VTADGESRLNARAWLVIPSGRLPGLLLEATAPCKYESTELCLRKASKGMPRMRDRVHRVRIHRQRAGWQNRAAQRLHEVESALVD